MKQPLLLAVVLTLSVLFSGHHVSAATALGCLPEAPVTDGTFKQVPNTQTTFACTVSTEGNQDLFLLGKLTDPSGKTAASSSALSQGVTALEATLVFPPVFPSGNYFYTFSLLERSTGNVLTTSTLTGVIEGGAKASIKTVVADQVQYAWGVPATLTVSLDLPEGQSEETLFLSAVLKDTTGQSCVTLKEETPLTGAESTLSFMFPETLGCTNGVLVSLTDATGSVLDQETIAVGLPPLEAASNETATETTSSSVSPMLIAFLVGTITLILALGGYFFLRRR